MSAWAEVRQLQDELYNVQLQTTKNKLSERNCIAVIQRLIDLGWLEVIYSCDGKEYITPKQLEKDICDELYVCGGRVAMTDLAQTLNVDYSHIDKKVTELLAHDSSLSIHYGELISKQFFDNLAVEINETLQETGILPLAQLSREVSLPVATLSKEFVPRVGELIEGTYDIKTDTLFTTAFVERQAAKLRGACSAATRPVQLGRVMESHGIKSSLGYNCVKDMIASGRLLGQLQGQSNNPVFIPALYTSSQNKWVASFYNQNGYITLEMMNKKGIDNAQAVMAKFENSVLLTSGSVKESVLSGAQSIVEEAISSESYIELIDWMFDWCNAADEAKITEHVLKNLVSDKYRVLPSGAIVSVSLLNQLLLGFDDSIADQVKLDAVNPKILASLKKFDDVSAKVEDVKPKKGKGGKKGKKGKNQEEDYIDVSVQAKHNIGPTYLSSQQIEKKLRLFPVFVENEPKEETTLPEVSELLRRELNEKYCKALDEEVRKKTQKASKSQQMSDEVSINNLYNTILLCEKGLKVFEESVKVQIEKHLLKTLCNDLAKATFSILGEEYECPFHGDQLKLESVISYLPKGAKDHAKGVVTAVTTGSSLEEFLDSYSNITDPQFTGLLVKKLDKKKERNMIFAQKQSLLEQLKVEDSAPELLNIACNLIFIKQNSCLLHVPGRCMSSVVRTVSAGLSQEQVHGMEAGLGKVVAQLKGEGSMEEEEKQALRDLVTEVLFAKQTPDAE